VPELGMLGSVRGALSNERPYRDIEDLSRAPTLSVQRKATCPRAPTQALGRPGVVREPGMYARSLYGNREVSRSAEGSIELTVRGGKARSHSRRCTIWRSQTLP
jgi:hypothetical protein